MAQTRLLVDTVQAQQPEVAPPHAVKQFKFKFKFKFASFPFASLLVTCQACIKMVPDGVSVLNGTRSTWA